MDDGLSQIAIVGAAGRVASRVIPILQTDFSLKLGDIRDSATAFPPIHPVDLLNPDSLTPFLTGVKAVVHFAIASYDDSTTGLSEKEIYHQQALKINVAGTYNLFEAARIAGVSRVIYISSLTVSMGADTNFAESLPPCPVDLYACTKLFGENLAELYSRKHHMHCFSLRLGQPYPLGLPQEETLRRDSRYSHTFVTIGDIARAVKSALQTDRKEYGVYNVVSPTEGDRVSLKKGQEIGFQPTDSPEASQDSRSAA